MGRNRGGAKVPGVKLRPAGAKPAQSKKNVIESDDEEDILLPTPPRGQLKIFKDVVLCATGIKNKREVFDLVKRMGGAHSTDFTDLTTHLLAEAPGSQKYKCAIERQIPVLTPAWVYDAHSRWISGEMFALDALMESHRLLPFHGVRLCITGIETADVRARIHKLIKRNGGEYLKALDKTCTHVLCATHDTEKINFANKTNREREILKIHSGSQDVPEPIQLVWEAWFWDCIYMKGLLDCQPYHITNEKRLPMSRDVMESPEVLTTSLPAQRTKLPPPVPLASLLSDPGDSITQVKRKKDAGMKEWESIVKRQGFAVVNGEMRNMGSSSYSMEQDESLGQSSTSPLKKAWAPNNLEPPMMAKGWSRRSPVKKQATFGMNQGSSSPRRPLAIRLPSDADIAEAGPESARSFLGKMSRTAAFDDPRPDNSRAGDASKSATDDAPTQILSGMTVSLLGDASCEAVTKAILGVGGRILRNGVPDYYVVRLVGGDQHMLSRPVTEQSKFRTECWLERSLFEKRLCAVEENMTYAPIVIRSPPEDNMLISLSSLDTFERTWVSRLLRLLGVQISASFSSQCTHLLCPTRDGVKCRKAEEWNIPVVDLDWLKQLTTMATMAKEMQTPSPETNHAHQLPMEKSLEAMKLDIKAPTPSLELLTRQGAVSPVFKVATPTGFNGYARPPSPHSPSPQGKRVTQSRAGTSETNGSARPVQRTLTSSITKASNQTPVRQPMTQRVPSSASPSPLRMQGPVAIAAKEPVSLPSTLAFQLTSAKTLSKNIGAVLGSKRPADEDSESGVGMANVTDGGPRKRPRRPQPSLAREPSPKKLSLATTLMNYDHDREVYQEGDSGSSLSVMETPPESAGGIVINYIDPNEAQEQRRLRMLLDGEEFTGSEPIGKEKRPTKTLQPRRSGRHKG